MDEIEGRTQDVSNQEKVQQQLKQLMQKSQGHLLDKRTESG